MNTDIGYGFEGGDYGGIGGGASMNDETTTRATAEVEVDEFFSSQASQSESDSSDENNTTSPETPVEKLSQETVDAEVKHISSRVEDFIQTVGSEEADESGTNFASYIREQAKLLKDSEGREMSSTEMIKHLTDYLQGDHAQALQAYLENKGQKGGGHKELLQILDAMDKARGSESEPLETVIEGTKGLNNIVGFVQKTGDWAKNQATDLYELYSLVSGDSDTAIDKMNVPGILNLIFQSQGGGFDGVMGSGKFARMAESKNEYENKSISLFKQLLEKEGPTKIFLQSFLWQENESPGDVLASDQLEKRMTDQFDVLESGTDDEKTAFKKKMVDSINLTIQKSPDLYMEEITIDSLNLSEDVIKLIYLQTRKWIQRSSWEKAAA